jgi:hypothetical protein
MEKTTLIHDGDMRPILKIQMTIYYSAYYSAVQHKNSGYGTFFPYKK